MTTQCGSCGASVGDGGRLCTGCARDLAQLLLTAASIAPDLDDAVAKQLRRGTGGKRSEADAPLPVDLNAGAVTSALRMELLSWVRPLAAQHVPIGPVCQWCRHPSCSAIYNRGRPVPEIEPMAKWLAGRLPALRQHPEAAVAHREIRDAVHRALAVVDRKPERAPAGLCDNCGQQLLAELGADSVTCGCGMTVLALQDKRRERAAAADVLGTAAEIHGALKRIGIDIPRGTITSWGSRGRLAMRPGGVYAMSDVLALHAQSQARVGR